MSTANLTLAKLLKLYAAMPRCKKDELMQYARSLRRRRAVLLV